MTAVASPGVGGGPEPGRRVAPEPELTQDPGWAPGTGLVHDPGLAPGTGLAPGPADAPSPAPGPGPGPGPGPAPERERERRGGLRLLNLLLIIPVLIAAAGAYAIVTHAFMPRTVRTYQVPAVFNLQASDCFDTGQNGEYVAVLPCVSAHDAEVFATFTLPASGWPGVDTVQSAADAGCATRASGYLGSELAASSLTRNTTYPDQVTWQAGVRTVVCTVSSSDGKTTGSFRQLTPSPSTAPTP